MNILELKDLFSKGISAFVAFGTTLHITIVFISGALAAFWTKRLYPFAAAVEVCAVKRSRLPLNSPDVIFVFPISIASNIIKPHPPIKSAYGSRYQAALPKR